MIVPDVGGTRSKGYRDLMQPHVSLQILRRASRECRLLVIIQPTVSFFIARSLATDKYCTSLPATDKSGPMFDILQAVVKGFATDNVLISGMVDPAASKDLLTISPQQVLPFTMDWTASATRHLIPAKLHGPLKTLVMLTQIMELAVEKFAHLEPEALQEQAQQICNPTQEQLEAAKQRGWPVGVSVERDAVDKAAGDEISAPCFAVPAEASAAATAEPAAEAAAAEAAAALPADSHDSEISKIPHADLMQTMADMHVDSEAGEQPL